MTDAQPTPAAQPSSGPASTGSASTGSDSAAADVRRNGPPAPGLAIGLLVMAAVLIVIVLVEPDFPDWLRTTIAILAVLTVVALLVYSVLVMRMLKRGRR